MFHKILVGFDGSEPSERALRAACTIAKQFGATLEVSHSPADETVVYAAEAISGFYIGTSVAADEALREAAKEMAKKASEIGKGCGFDPLEVHVGHGDPATDLLARAKTDKVDLIVTGRRGLGNLRGLILGSTSQAIAARADCAYLTVA